VQAGWLGLGAGLSFLMSLGLDPNGPPIFGRSSVPQGLERKTEDMTDSERAKWESFQARLSGSAKQRKPAVGSPTEVLPPAEQDWRTHSVLAQAIEQSQNKPPSEPQSR
jgi:hypothetical protein